jgi:DNA-binding GntR family transcriptional regulator
LHELAGACVIEHVERRGFRARPFHRDDMLAFLDVRAALEVQALDLAKAQLTNADLARFLQGNDAAAIARRSIDNGLHAYFVLKSNNHYLSAFFASHGRYYARLFDFATVDSNRLAEMAGQHTEILKHAMARRWARARTVLRHHIHSQAPVLGAVMDQLEAHPELTTSND